MELAEIKKLFDFFDKDESGTIDSHELAGLLLCIGEHPAQAEVNDLLAVLDKNNSGSIEWEEFLSEMQRRLENKDVEVEIKAVFKLFDRDETGVITNEGVLHVMNAIFKEGMTIEEADDMIRVVAGQQSFITYEEFKSTMTERFT